jgi:hypothetical protein
VVTIGVFDATKQADAKRVSRRGSGPKAEAMLLESVDPMLRELFGLSPPKPKLISTIESPLDLPVPSMVAGGVGVASLITAGVLGLISQSTESDYASAPVSTKPEIDNAVMLRDRGEGQAAAANVFLAVGIAALVAGAALLFFPGKAEEEPALAGVPSGDPLRGVRW